MEVGIYLYLAIGAILCALVPCKLIARLLERPRRAVKKEHPCEGP